MVIYICQPAKIKLKELIMKKIIIISLVLLSLITGLTLITCERSKEPPVYNVQEEINTITTVLSVRNMRCNNCVNAIRRDLRTLEGVRNVSADVRARRVTVEHDPTLDVNVIRERIIEAGFNVN